MYIRFRVKAASKKWTDPGPDLLRQRHNAAMQLESILPRGVKLQYREDSDGLKTAYRHGVLEAFNNDHFRSFEVFAAGKQIAAAVRVAVNSLPTANSSPGVVLGRSLVEAQFPGITFAGAFVYKEDSWGWSDHAWGDAFDETATAGKQTNDQVFDWVHRMAVAGCMDYDYAIGSKDGRVVSCSAPDFPVVDGGGDNSHLWHVHVSVVNHHGAKPPTANGYA